MTNIPKSLDKNSNKKKIGGSIKQQGNRGNLPKRPGDVNRWGREGEKYRPEISPAADNNVNNQQQAENTQGQYIIIACIYVHKRKSCSLTKIR